MKKTWIYMKCGLSRDPKHRAQMDECVWLYMHMIDLADWSTGIVYSWKDPLEADEMSMPLPTLRHQRRKLERLGYITCVQRQQAQDIIIHRWINPKDYSGKVLNVPEDLDPQGDNPLTPSPKSQGDKQGDKPLTPPEGGQGDNHGDNHSDNHPSSGVITPTLSSISESNERVGGEVSLSSDFEAELTELGIYVPIWNELRALIGRGWTEADLVAIIDWMMHTQENKTAAAASFVLRIREGSRAPREFYNFGMRRAMDRWYPGKPDTGKSDTGKSGEGDDPPEVVMPYSPRGVLPSTASAHWETALGQLEQEMPRASFQSYLKDSYPVDYVDGCLYIGVRNAYTRDWLEERLSTTVERLMIGIMNQSVDIAFVVVDTTPAE